MRNLKKILALVLALMMVLSVMVTASAAFEDADSINPAYEQAVEVMAAAGILKGTGNGFEPTKTLDRASAAKLVAYLALNTGIEAITQCETIFDDVPAAHWASGYIGYCYDASIVNGNSATTYNPAGNITVESYAKLLLGVLGIEGTYTGDKWYVAVRNNAVKNGLMAGMTGYTWTADITREEAAQMTFNAMKAGSTVTPDSGYWYFEQDSKVVKIEEEDIALYTALGMDIKWQEVKGSSTGLLATFKIVPDYDDTDKYGAPAVSYTIGEGKDQVVLYYPAAESAIITEALTEAEVATLLKGYTYTTAKSTYKVEDTKTTANWYNVEIVTEDGGDYTFVSKTQSLAAALAGLTGDNTVVRVYADSKNVITAVVVTNTYVEAAGEVTKASEDGKTPETPETIKVNGTDVVNVGLKEGQIVTYTLCNGVVENLAAAEYIVGTLSGWNSKGEYTINGETYTLDGSAVSASAVQAQFGKAYAYYTGANNTVIYASAVPGTEPEAPVAPTVDGYAIVTDVAVKVESGKKETVDIWGQETTTYNPSVTVMVKVMDNEGNTVAYSLPLAQAAKAENGLAKGDYYVTVAGTTYKVCDKNGENQTLTENALTTALGTDIYTYNTVDGVINLLAKVGGLGTYIGSEAATSGSYASTVANGMTITKSTLALSGAAYRNKVLLMTEDTVVILKGTDKDGNTIIVTKSVAELEKTTVTAGTKIIVDVTGDGEKAENNVYTVAVVFAQEIDFTVDTTGDEAKETDNYVYVSETDYVVSGLDKNNNPVYTFSGLSTDGTIVAINTTDLSTIKTGVYVLMDDGTLGDPVEVKSATISTVAAGKYILDGTTVVVTDKDTVVVGGELVAGAKVLYTATGSTLDVVYVVEMPEA